jgi:hypothetical protein
LTFFLGCPAKVAKRLEDKPSNAGRSGGKRGGVMGRYWDFSRLKASHQFVVHQFLSQGISVQAQPHSRLRLVALRVAHDDLKQWFFHHTHQHLVQVVRLGPAQIFEVTLHAHAHSVLYLFFTH